MSARKIIIDTDPGIDDAMAIAAAPRRAASGQRSGGPNRAHNPAASMAISTPAPMNSNTHATALGCRDSINRLNAKVTRLVCWRSTGRSAHAAGRS